MSAHYKAEIKLALQTLKETYPEVKDLHYELWELLVAAMNSQHADTWDHNERANKMYIIELLGRLVEKLYNKKS